MDLSDRQFERVKQKILDSAPGVEFLARCLRNRGYSVTVPPTTVVDNVEDWRDGVDNGDLYIDGIGRCEVKHITKDFTCLADWPLKPHFIVNARGPHDRADPKPVMYFIMNRGKTHVAIVKTSTFERWRVDTRTDYTTEGNPKKEYYFAPLDCVHFRSLL